MTEIRRWFVSVKKRILPDRTSSARGMENKTVVKKDERSPSVSEVRKNENFQMRRTPDLIKSHSHAELPPIPSNQEPAFHGVIRGYPAVKGHIYEEIPTNELEADSSSCFPLNSGQTEKTEQGGRGGVFYISPIDGALHRLQPERGDRIICPHLHFDRGLSGPYVQRQASFKRRLFGKHLSVCKDCAKSLRERFVSGEPDVIYPTYWHSVDLGEVNIPCPSLPENFVSRNENVAISSTDDQTPFRRERRHSLSAEEGRVGLRKVGEPLKTRRKNVAAESVDNVSVLDKLSCRATKYRLPEVESKLLGMRANRGCSGARQEERFNVATHRSMNNLLLSDILRRNHDRQCLVW